MKYILSAIVVIILAAAGWYFLVREAPVPQNAELPSIENPVVESPPQDEGTTVIGRSAGGADINAFHFGSGEEEILFVGGIHGGYSWNTALVAYELMDHLEANPDTIPSNVRVTVIPVANPDGLKKVVGTTSAFAASDVSTSANLEAARFNENTVDLNRNFDCDWQEDAVWQKKQVSGGTAVFSEPETQAIRDYVEESTPKAVIVWYASAGGVYASNCHNGVLPETSEILNRYAQASGYRAYQDFDYYETTGDMTNWLAKIGIPSISVLLTNHTNTEWAKNRAGIEAVLDYYTN
ncbi:hypothetical protein C4585_02715 [Candidatus Parcubacteria bacterium]|nr:MAG: hypothetical protein C4585_02715 [Candidatus Parcubacteria bacterium]